MKQRFYVVIVTKEKIDPKDVLFALREARPKWGGMSASLAAQQSVERTAIQPAPIKEFVDTLKKYIDSDDD